jgi:hypothetical protein
VNDPIRAQETTLAIASSWTKSSLSHANGNCLEVADLASKRVGIRDSKYAPSGPILQFPPEEWRAFVNGARNGEFDWLVK